PEDPFCPDAGFRLRIQSESLAGLAKRTISYRWTADPNHITPSSGEVAGSKDPNNKYVWIGEIPLVAHNNTSNQIVSTITVIPVVYEANGNLACELEPEEYDVTILPYAIVCPDDIEADITNPALCNISITTENPTYSNCVSPTDFSWSMTGATTGSGTGFVGTREFNLGTTTVTYTAANDDGSSSQCSFEVTVNDPFPPVLDCPDNMTVNTDPDMCSAVVHYALPDITDNCVDSTVVISQIAGLASGSVFPAGVTTNTFVATDASGNVSEPCSFSVTVVDAQDPVIISPGQLTVSCPSKIPANATDYSSFVALGGVASDNCSEVTVSWVSDIISNQTCSNRYTVTRTYLATDAQGNSSTCEQIITVNDQTAPVIQTTPGSLDDILECSDTTAIALALALEPAAIDNCNDSPTLHLINDVTTPTIPGCSDTYTRVRTWNFTDDCGNASPDFVQTIVVYDNTPPVITAGTINACYPTRAEAEAAAINATSAIDNCSSAVTFSASTSGTCSAVVTVSATDACGNRSQVTYNTRIDNTPPSITTGTIAPCYPTVGAAQAAALAATSVTDNCSSPSQIILSVSTSGTCPATITVTAVDGCGLSASATYTTVIDNTPPVITAGSINACYPTRAEAEAAAINATSATDNCAPAVTFAASTSGTCSAVVTVSATDACGNRSQVTYNTRIDNRPPVITAGSINACYPTRAEAEAAALNATSAIDNCSSAVTFSASTSGTCNAVVTVSATDACGNRSQVTYNIRIDNIPPVINGSISNITVEGCDQNAATVPVPANTVAQLEALGLTIADACTPDNQLLVTHQDAVEGSCPVVITRTYTVTDLCGNESTASYQISVDDTTPPVINGSISNITVEGCDQ
ncbi:MAG TPA: HYR domain-containing protein, partial [Bacteroidales bacterium]|nr:HYR domain-containing protein [Bacteroidales bacterium]